MNELPSGSHAGRPMPSVCEIISFMAPLDTLMAAMAQRTPFLQIQCWREDCFSVGGPGDAEHAESYWFGVQSCQGAIVGAGGVGDMDFDLVAIGDAAHVGELLGVWGEAGGGIDIADDLARGTAEDWHGVEIVVEFGAFVGADEVDVIAIWRERDADDAERIWGEDLDVAFGGYVADPEALLLAVDEDVDDVAAVWGDGDGAGFAAVGELGDLHVLQI